MQLFLDMDGVLADLFGSYERAFGESLLKTTNTDWSKCPPGFWASLDPMRDFDELWGATAHLNPIVLTGLPKSRTEEARWDKRTWLDRHCGPSTRMIGCPAEEKWKHMLAPGDVLVDDWTRYRNLWLSAGGRWVTHLDAETTIVRLEDLDVL